ncbi:MAG: hypothetical protein PHR06_09450, partial [Candidatus Cloacimonetes bacterium]|nr:hypothetical protein [Candidatus Cloacimonadota bacterium]
MKRFLLVVVVISLLIPALMSQVTYLNDDEYKKLSKNERNAYWQELEAEMENLHQRKADAIAKNQADQKRIEELNAELQNLKREYAETRSRIMATLGLSEADMAAIKQKIDYFNSTVSQWNNMSDKQIWEYKKSIRELISEYKDYRNS